ncbi:MAG TPA: hypothetical protein VGE84_07975 [Allosphingosinicella sp.]
MGIGKLLGLLVALSVLFAPSVAAAADRAMAAATHDMPMMEMGHCDAPPSGQADQDKNAGHSCCLSMCMGVAVTPGSPATEKMVVQVQPTFVPPRSLLGFLGEIATPPPRLA